MKTPILLGLYAWNALAFGYVPPSCFPTFTYRSSKKLQQTPGTYPGPSTTCLNMKILPCILGYRTGMFQGFVGRCSCWLSLSEHSGHHDDALSICALPFQVVRSSSKPPTWSIKPFIYRGTAPAYKKEIIESKILLPQHMWMWNLYSECFFLALFQ